MSSHHLVIVAVVAAFSTAQADTIYVDANCPGGDGSQADPYCSIQTAIDNAVDTDEIVIAPGTYFETINFLGKAVTLRSSDGPDVTIINAQGAGSVVTCDHVEGPDTVLEGFTITGGTGTWISLPPSFRGGGMINRFSSSPTVTDCTFSNNTADQGGGMSNGEGGGASPTVTNCTFSGNGGGGMFNSGGSPTVTNCTFSNNSAGGMTNLLSSPVVTDCLFSGNTESGGMSNGGGSPTVTGCTFSGNSDDFEGGGMGNANSSPTVTNCTFSNNLTVNALGGGGGMNNAYGSSPTVTNCMFVGNEAQTGGGMHNFVSPPTVINCTFIDNSAFNGGGMSNNSSVPTVTNCSFVANQEAAVWNTGLGGSFPIIKNCLMWANGLVQVLDGSDSESTVLYSDVQGGFPGTGNIDADPQFVDPDNGDFRLSPGSPCIDAGHNNAIAGLADTDLDGNPRFADDPATADTGCGVPVVVDMGPYEYQGDPATVLFGDVNGDGRVGVMDMFAIMRCMGSGDPDCCVADIDMDGEVGMPDVMLLVPQVVQSLSPD